MYTLAKILFSTLPLGALAAEPPAAETQAIVAAGEARSLAQSWSVAPDARIEVSNVRGSVAVSAWDQAEVELSGRLGADSRLSVIAAPKRLSLRVEGTKSGWFGGQGPRDDSELVLRVPRTAALDLSVVSADATVSGIAGKSLEANSVSGTLRLTCGAPEVEVNSVSGEVVFTTLPGSATTRAHLQTVSGNIVAKGLGGRVKLETVSGEVRVDAAAVQELEVGTVSGDVSIAVVPAAHARLRLESMSGDLRLRLPATLSAHLEASTFSGGIHSDFGRPEEEEHGPGSSLDAHIGDGDAAISVQSFSGDIELRRQ